MKGVLLCQIVFCSITLMTNKTKHIMISNLTPPIVPPVVVSFSPRLCSYHHVHLPKFHLNTQLVFLLSGCASSSLNRCVADGQYKVVHSILWCVIQVSITSSETFTNFLLLNGLYFNPISSKSLRSDSNALNTLSANLATHQYLYQWKIFFPFA